MTSVRFHDAARRELAEEVLYYAEIDRRLGERLFESVQRAVALAAEFPEMGSPYLFKTRRVFSKRFPFQHRGDGQERRSDHAAAELSNGAGRVPVLSRSAAARAA